VLALILLAIGVLGFLGSVAGVTIQLLPRKFSAVERQQITDWEYGERWRTLPASAIFPASVSYGAPDMLSDDASLKLSARRIGIARQESCAAAADPSAARLLDARGCTAVLRASYVDSTDSYVMTVGAAVLPSATQAAAAARAINDAPSVGGLGPAVHTVTFAGTPAAAFTESHRQLSGAVTAGDYVILYTVGYADDRPREPVSGDRYTVAEMTSAGTGVAHAVLAVLAAPVAPPHCPGTPGC